MTDSSDDCFQIAAKLIQESHHAIVFTGAGISTPSGIPDFRSTGTGLWQKSDPMLFASLTAFRYHPDRFFRWLKPLLQASKQAVPNPAHLAISRLEQLGRVKSVITQNIDNLHQKAGSGYVIELHGSMEQFHCPSCQKPASDPAGIIEEIISGQIPYCTHCGTIMKPDITLYEEPLPMKAWQQASDEVSRADLMFVIGSSLEVIPASSLPYDTYRNGGRIIILNYSPTFMDKHADVVIREDAAEVLPGIVELISDLEN